MSKEKYLLRLYPRLWRKRYEEELLAMLEQRPISFLDGLDLLFGAFDAYLHPHLGTTGLSLYERIMQMISTLRRSLLMTFCAYIGFVVAGIGFQKLTEYDDFIEAAHTQSVIGISFNLVVAGSIVALLAVLAGGLPIVFAIIRSAFARRRYGSLFLLAIPVLAFVIFLGTTLLLERIWPAHAPALQTHASRGIFLSVFFGAAIASTGAVCFAVARSEISERILRFAVLPSLLATLAMALMLAATIIWGLGLRSSVPQLFNSNEGMFGTSTAGSWLQIVIIMAIATILAAISLIRGLSARSALRGTAA